MQLITTNGTRMNYIAASSVAIGTITSQSAVNSSTPISKSASDAHKFFVSKIGLNFYTGTWSSYSSTGSGSMKYILGS